VYVNFSGNVLEEEDKDIEPDVEVYPETFIEEDFEQELGSPPEV
jgi:hypothetical protein